MMPTGYIDLASRATRYISLAVASNFSLGNIVEISRFTLQLFMLKSKRLAGYTQCMGAFFWEKCTPLEFFKSTSRFLSKSTWMRFLSTNHEEIGGLTDIILW
jgi:hypothetical protein